MVASDFGVRHAGDGCRTGQRGSTNREEATSTWASHGWCDHAGRLRSHLVLLALNELVHDPANALATLLHRSRDLPLEVPTIAPHIVLERLVAAANADQHFLADHLAVNNFHACQVVGGLHVLDWQVVRLTQCLDRPDDVGLDRAGCRRAAAEALVVRLEVLLQLHELVGVVCVRGLIVALVRRG